MAKPLIVALLLAAGCASAPPASAPAPQEMQEKLPEGSVVSLVSRQDGSVKERKFPGATDPAVKEIRCSPGWLWLELDGHRALVLGREHVVSVFLERPRK